MDIEPILKDKFPELNHNGLHPKNKKLKDQLLNAPHWICMERAKYYTDSFKQTEGEPSPIKVSKAQKMTFKNMTITINPDEILVGNRSSKHIAPPIAPERGDMTFVLKYMLPVLKKKHGYKITKEHKNWLLKYIIPYWKGKTVRDLKVQKFEELGLASQLKLGDGGLKRIKKAFGLKHILKMVEDPQANWKDKLDFFLHLPRWIQALKAGTSDNVKGRGRVIDTQAHIVVGHKNVLKYGFKGIKERAEEQLKIIKKVEKQNFLKAVLISCEAIRDFSQRFSDLAEEMSKNELDASRKEELLKISEITKNVPWNPPKSFYEAIQALWFTQNAVIITYGAGSGITPGRVDQLLYPFYKEDIERGLITNDEVLRLIEEFIIKINNNVVIWPNIMGVRLNHLGSDIENITIGGVGPNGEDATNSLSYLFIEAVKNTNLATSASFRFSKNTPIDFKKKVLEIHKFTNSPALFNDEIFVKALERDGYATEAARDYCLVGCVEPSGNGDTYGATGGTKLYFPSILDLVINRGRTTFFGSLDTIDTGNPAEFKSFDDLMNAFYIQLKQIIETVTTATILRDEIWASKYPNPLISCTIDGCIENGIDATAGGSTYKFQAVGAGGLGTVVDSLTALQKFVFEEKKISMAEIVEALNSNFTNMEKLRQMLSNGPKFGNDDDYVDTLAVEIVDRFAEMVNAVKLPHGGHFKPSLISYGLNVYEGALEPATPNGRKAGEPLSNSISPSNGAEQKGPTAAFNSVAKIDHVKIGYGDSLNMRFPNYLVNDEEGLEIFRHLVDGYFEKGGMHVQVITMGTETLLDAQKHPENYNDLIVRVSGYAAYFTRLGKEIQDDIIDRIEFSDLKCGL